jgi:hypothetical protein
MDIISRARWGARYSAGFGPSPLPARELWLHHSVTVAPDLTWVDADGDGVEDDEERAMRTLEDIGQQRFGGGVSYTFAIMPSGRIYEGHGVGRQGAHTGGRNDIARAIVLVGDYSTRPPTDAQQRATAWLVEHGRKQGWWTVYGLSGGHRQAPNQVATACPGDAALREIPTVNRLAADYRDGRTNLDQEEAPDMDAAQNSALAAVYEGTIGISLEDLRSGKKKPLFQQHGDFYVDELTRRMTTRFAAIEARLDALGGTLGDDEAKLLAAIRSQPTGGQVDVAQLAAALAPMLPAGTTPDQIQDALRSVLRTGVDDEEN